MIPSFAPPVPALTFVPGLLLPGREPGSGYLGFCQWLVGVFMHRYQTKIDLQMSTCHSSLISCNRFEGKKSNQGTRLPENHKNCPLKIPLHLLLVKSPRCLGFVLLYLFIKNNTGVRKCSASPDLPPLPVHNTGGNVSSCSSPSSGMIVPSLLAIAAACKYA